MAFALLQRRKTNFLLWVPGGNQQPSLILGKLDPLDLVPFCELVRTPLRPAQDNVPDLWELPCGSLGLPDGVYHYWFEINDTSLNDKGQPNNFGKILVTDPFTYTVDYRLVKDPGYQPAAVIKLEGSQLKACDPAGKTSEPG